jgi:hypothetical protein
MCTISVIPLRLRSPGVLAQESGFRIVCNRDEDRRRVPAANPKWRAIERPGVPGARAIWPMDMEAGGTWIAAAEHGLALCLLNLNPEPPIDLRGVRGLKSRGLVIPALIGAATAAEAMKRLERLSLKSFAPFRLVAVDGRTDELSIAEARWDRTSLQFQRHDSESVCFASSGLGDSKVTPRLDLFQDTVVEGDGAIADRQDEFHRHTWPDRPEVSVLMSREEARTVSIATVEAMPDGRGSWDVVMEYSPVPADGERTTDGAPVGRAAGAR